MAVRKEKRWWQERTERTERRGKDKPWKDKRTNIAVSRAERTVRDKVDKKGEIAGRLIVSYFVEPSMYAKCSFFTSAKIVKKIIKFLK